MVELKVEWKQGKVWEQLDSFFNNTMAVDTGAAWGQVMAKGIAYGFPDPYWGQDMRTPVPLPAGSELFSFSELIVRAVTGTKLLFL